MLSTSPTLAFTPSRQQMDSLPQPASTVTWPRTLDVLGVNVSATTYDELVQTLIAVARSDVSAIVDFSPVDIIVQAKRNEAFRRKINSFDVICPDGQPVRWFLNYFYGAGLSDRVCGTISTLRLWEAAARDGVSVYLY